MWKCNPVWAAYGPLAIALVCALCLVQQASSAAVGNVTVTAPKVDLGNVELNVSDSRNVYRAAPSPRRVTPESAESTVGFYKANIEDTGIPAGIRANLKQQRPTEEEEKSAAQRTRAGRQRTGGRGGSRPSADLFEEDAEELDEKDLKGRGRSSKRPPGASDGRGYKPFGAGGERDAEIIEDKAGVRRPGAGMTGARLQAGYKPFGGGEVERPEPLPVRTPKEQYKSEDDDDSAADYEEPHGSYSSGSSSSSGSHSGSGDNEEYTGGSAADDDEDGGHLEEVANTSDNAGYKSHDDEVEDDGHHVASVGDVSVKDDLVDDKKLLDLKPVAEHADNSETQASHGSHRSAPLHHHGAADHHFVKEGAKKHNSEHHSAVGEKGKKGYKKKEAHASGEQGKHGKESHKAHAAAKKGHKKAHLDQDGKYAEKHEAEKGSKGTQFADNGKHKKGHATKGFRTVHRKDEFKKDETFYDESDTSGHHSKKGAAAQHHAAKKGEKQEKKHLDSKIDEAKAAKEGEKGQNSHVEHKKGHKGVDAHQSQHRSLAKNAKEGGQKVAHQHAHANAGSSASDHHDDY